MKKRARVCVCSCEFVVKVGQRVRWQILEKMPSVADVMVNIAVETKPCPAMSSLRPQEDIEQARRRDKEVWDNHF